MLLSKVHDCRHLKSAHMGISGQLALRPLQPFSFFLWQVSHREEDFALYFSRWSNSTLSFLCSFLIVAANFYFLWLHFKLKDLIMLQFRFSVALWKRTWQSLSFKLWWKTLLLNSLKSIRFTAELYLLLYKQQVMWEVFKKKDGDVNLLNKVMAGQHVIRENLFSCLTYFNSGNHIACLELWKNLKVCLFMSNNCF